MVLENHDRLKTSIAQQVVQPNLQGTQDAFDMLNRVMSQETVMLGRFDEYLVRSAATHASKQKPALIPVIIVLDA
jgi:hypothetical protein